MAEFLAIHKPASLIASKSKSTNLPYLAGLDGLRGVAVLSVMFGHFDVPGFSVAGGYGVDVFFVLSGYLITTILLADLAARRPIARFYWNRATRLVPALLLVCLAIFLIPSSLLSSYGAALNALGALTYTTDWTRAIPVIGWSNYLAHTWSLSVEEQFYLAWPLVLKLASRGGERAVRATILTACAMSLL